MKALVVYVSTHYGNTKRIAEVIAAELAARLPVTRARAFVFSTRGSWRVGRAHNSLKRILNERGFQIIGEFSCRGHDTVGPLKYIGGVARGRPNDQDLMTARDFAKQLVAA